jgi:hypothetical protein
MSLVKRNWVFPGDQAGGQLLVEVLQVLDESLASLHLGVVMPADVGTMRQIVAAGL